jgi:hypothetical protein
MLLRGIFGTKKVGVIEERKKEAEYAIRQFTVHHVLAGSNHGG